MSTPHHGNHKRLDLSQEDAKMFQRYLEQSKGSYQRSFPDGRISAEDDGELTFAIATDVSKGVIIIKFAHPTDWIGLDRKTAEMLRDQLTERLHKLRGIPT